MATVDDVQVSSSIGIDGNSYTTSISNDTLTNDDFLKLMLEEMKMQDPTEPMDSSQLMDSQLKMSTIQANVDMAAAMAAMQTAYGNSALANASNLIGRVVEDGQINDEGMIKSYKVLTVESVNGELYVNVNEMVGYIDTLYNPELEEYIRYDSNGYLYDSEGEPLEIAVKMEEGRFVLDESNNITLLDTSGDVITDESITALYQYGGEVIDYDTEIQKLPLGNLQKIW